MAVLSLTIDGVRYDDYVEERTLLVHLLRERLGKVSTHVGCDTNECGACTVLLDGRAVKSCSVLALQADGRTVTTIDSASLDIDTPLSQAAVLPSLARAFHRHRATPCGFCAPGMLLPAADLLTERPAPSEDDVRDALAGTWCRCGDEHAVVCAVLSAATELQGRDTSAETTSQGSASRDTHEAGRGGADPTTSDQRAPADHTLAGHPGASP